MKTMPRYFSGAIIILITFVFGGTLVFAAAETDEIPGKNSKSIIDVLTRLETKGYTHISSIEFDDYLWKVKTLENGEETKYHVDPKSLVIRKIKTEKEDDLQPPQEAQSLKEALRLVSDKGYKTIRSIEFKKGRWEVEVIDDKIEKEFVIDPGTRNLFEKIDD